MKPEIERLIKVAIHDIISYWDVNKENIEDVIESYMYGLEIEEDKVVLELSDKEYEEVLELIKIGIEEIIFD